MSTLLEKDEIEMSILLELKDNDISISKSILKVIIIIS